MPNIIDYVKWRGDVSFSERPLNVIDALIFAELSYLRFDDIVPSSINKGSPLSIVCDKFFALHYDSTAIGAFLPTNEIHELFKLCAHSRRFANVGVKGFINEIDMNAQKQFCAVCFDIGKSTTVVTFRGTDDTIIGWKEDLNMAFFTPIPSQRDSVKYLESIISESGREQYVVCGHSKGGNLASYSALMINSSLQDKIVGVYSFDGPGFKQDFVKSIKNNKIIPKMCKISPESTLIGAVFNSVAKCKYVKSTAKGLYQHDAFSWEVLGSDFLFASKPSKGSIDFHNTLESLVDNLTDKEKIEFVDALYKFMTVNDATTLTDVASDKLKFIFGILKTDMKTKKTVFDLMNRLIKEKYFKKSDPNKKAQKKK